MKRQTAGKRLAAELAFIGAAAAAAVVFFIWLQYRDYRDKMAIAAAVMEENRGKDTFSILKGREEISDAEVRELLKKYGYDKPEASRYGRRFLLESAGTAAAGVFLYGGFAFVLLYERRKQKKEQAEEWRMLAETLGRIRDGKYEPEYYDGCTEGDSHMTGVLDELDSLCGYLELVTGEAKKEKEETKALVTDISHQLKTPVAALDSCFEILQKESLSTEERQEFERRLAAQLKGLRELVGALVNISKLETGMIELKPEQGRIFDTILEAVNRVWEKAEARQIEIGMDADGEIEALCIRHDRKWITEAFVNVLENAVKYSPEKTSIRICVKKWNSFLRIEIHDEGIGIPQREYHRIFQRFYRGQDKEVKEREGQGIGLYLARKIINGHHGLIFVDGRQMKKEKGSVFVIQLPYTI